MTQLWLQPVSWMVTGDADMRYNICAMDAALLQRTSFATLAVITAGLLVQRQLGRLAQNPECHWHLRSHPRPSVGWVQWGIPDPDHTALSGHWPTNLRSPQSNRMSVTLNFLKKFLSCPNLSQILCPIHFLIGYRNSTVLSRLFPPHPHLIGLEI